MHHEFSERERSIVAQAIETHRYVRRRRADETVEQWRSEQARELENARAFFGDRANGEALSHLARELLQPDEITRLRGGWNGPIFTGRETAWLHPEPRRCTAAVLDAIATKMGLVDDFVLTTDEVVDLLHLRGAPAVSELLRDKVIRGRKIDGREYRYSKSSVMEERRRRSEQGRGIVRRIEAQNLERSEALASGRARPPKGSKNRQRGRADRARR